MAKLSIGKRRVGTRKPKTITPEALQDFKDTGRKVTEKPGGIVLLDGFRKFQVVGAGAKKVKEKADTEPKASRVDNELVDFVGGTEVETDFGVRVSGRRNELTEFV